jgi:prepilin-type N-terminal cleavage/methylation domain-containing protein
MKLKILYKSPGRKALSLIELLTTIVIMGVLTTAAIPLGEVVFIRDKELELKETLITTRGAIDKFNAAVGRYPHSFNELRWVEGQKLLDTQDRLDYREIGMPFLRKSPPINPFASSNQAWIVILTNTPAGLESITVADFLTARESDLINPDNNEFKEIYDIQFPAAGHPAFQYQITIYTSLEGHPYSTW